MASSGLSIDDVVNNVVGFAERVDTPFGEVCSLACDITNNGRPYIPIEDSVAKLRAHIGSRHQPSSFDGTLATNLHKFSKKQIFDFFGMSDKIYQIEECGPHEMSPYSWLGRILRVNYENGKWTGAKDDNNIDPKAPLIYISSSENYFNVLGWKYFGCRIETIEANKDSEVNIEGLKSKISNLSSINNHFVSLSAVSSITGQKIPNLQKIIESLVQLRTELALRNKNIRIFICLNVTYLVFRQKINIAQSYLKEIDFFILHSTKLIGSGFNSTNLLFSKKDSSNYLLASQRPVLDENNNILEAIEENSDVTKLYRVALSLELLSNLGPDKLAAIEQKNVSIFMSEIVGANDELRKNSPIRSINIWGAAASKSEFTCGNLNLNLYAPGSETFDGENRAYLHPQLVCSILNDIFGVMAVFKASLKLPDGQVLLNLPSNISSSMNTLCQPDSIVGCVSLEISALHKEEEVKYIATSLRMICDKGEEFQKYYDKKTFLMNNYNLETYEFNLTSMMNVKDTREEFVKKRQDHYNAQMTLAKTVFKNHSRYFSLHFGYLKEKTEQLRKKEVPKCMPPIVSVKKSPRPQEEFSDETILSYQKANIDIAQAKVKEILEDIEKQRKSKKVSKNPPTMVEVVLDTITESNVEKETEQISEEEQKQREEEDLLIKAQARAQVEKDMQELVSKRVSEEAKKEQEKTAALLEALKKEMQSKIDEAGKYKEQFVFEDLKPSVMFKNVLDFREKRTKNLHFIFDNYAKLLFDTQQILSQQDPKAKRKKGESLALLVNNNNNQQNNHTKSKKTLSLVNQEMYMLFTTEFKLSNEQVDESALRQIYQRSLTHLQESSTILSNNNISQGGEMNFPEFISSLEKISLIFFYNNNLLITSFDKIEALYQYMQIDEMPALKRKMKMKCVTYINQLITPQDNNIKSGSPSLPELHELDYDQIGGSKAKQQNTQRNSSAAPVKSIGQYQLNMFINRKPIEWGDSSQIPAISSENSIINKSQFSNLNQQEKATNNKGISSFFQNESNFLNNEYTQVNTINQQSYFSNNINPPLQKQLFRDSELFSNQKNFAAGGGDSYLVGAAGSGASSKLVIQSQQRNGQESSSKLNNFQGGDPTGRNSMLTRIKEIENTEMQKQKELLAFIQSKQLNRYNPHQDNKKK